MRGNNAMNLSEWLFIAFVKVFFVFGCISAIAASWILLAHLPVWVTLAYLVWISASIGAVVVSKRDGYEKTLHALWMTCIFTFLFVSVVSSRYEQELKMVGYHYYGGELVEYKGDLVQAFESKGETILLTFMSPGVHLIPIYFIGNWVQEAINEEKREKLKNTKKELTRSIRKCGEEIQQLEAQLHSHRRAVHLLSLLGECGAELSGIYGMPTVQDAVLLQRKIQQKKEEAQNLAGQLEDVKHKLRLGKV